MRRRLKRQRNDKKDIGGNEVCTERTTMAMKGLDQLTSNDTYFSDSWFSGVKTAEEAIA